MVHGGGRHQRLGVQALVVIIAAVAIVVSGSVWLVVNRWETTVSGIPRAADPVGKSDEDQIRDVLQAISDAYNRKDVRSGEMLLCARARAVWNPRLESVWMRFRMQHGTAEFDIKSIDVNGAVARVSGTQTYANDRKPQDFTAEMGRGTGGWKMCSSKAGG